MDIKINFINKSHDRNNSQVVIFEKNIAAGFEEIAVAWKVIKYCGINWSHQFTYPLDFEVAARDSFGNYSDLKWASYGQKWSVVEDDSGDILQLTDGIIASTSEIAIANGLSVGAIDAEIYRDGSLAAVKNGVSPGEKAVFEFEPYIYVGINSQVQEGEAMNSAVMKDFNTKISLKGINEAELVMTGGGTGIYATPFKFDLIRLS